MSDEEHKPFGKTAEELIGEMLGFSQYEPARQVKRPTKDLSKLVEELLVKHQIGRSGPEDQIRDNWPQIVGPANAHYSHAVNIDPRGRLLVLVSHAVVRNELHLHRQAILKRIQALPGCTHVKSILARAG